MASLKESVELLNKSCTILNKKIKSHRLLWISLMKYNIKNIYHPNSIWTIFLFVYFYILISQNYYYNELPRRLFICFKYDVRIVPVIISSFINGFFIGNKVTGTNCVVVMNCLFYITGPFRISSKTCIDKVILKKADVMFFLAELIFYCAMMAAMRIMLLTSPYPRSIFNT